MNNSTIFRKHIKEEIGDIKRDEAMEASSQLQQFTIAKIEI